MKRKCVRLNEYTADLKQVEVFDWRSRLLVHKCLITSLVSIVLNIIHEFIWQMKKRDYWAPVQIPYKQTNKLTSINPDLKFSSKRLDECRFFSKVFQVGTLHVVTVICINGIITATLLPVHYLSPCDANPLTGPKWASDMQSPVCSSC